MDTWLTQLLSSANGRHFREDELYRMLAYIDTIPDRLEAAKAVAEQKDFLTRTLTKQFSELTGNSAFIGDLVDMLQVVSHAMLIDDLSVMENMLAERIYTILVLMDFSQETLETMITALCDLLYTRIPSRSKVQIEPYLTWVSTHIGSFEGMMAAAV